MRWNEIACIRRIASALTVAAMLAAAASASRAEGLPSSEKGRVLYLENCASCHGRNLEGQPDWQEPLASGRLPAPPHDASGHTWHHPDRMLFEITKFGPQAILGPDYQSDMPAFAEVLDDAEIEAILDYIRSTWPEAERAFQEARTRDDRAATQSGQ